MAKSTLKIGKPVFFISILAFVLIVISLPVSDP
jgi:hypothetical protein